MPQRRRTRRRRCLFVEADPRPSGLDMLESSCSGFLERSFIATCNSWRAVVCLPIYLHRNRYDLVTSPAFDALTGRDSFVIYLASLKQVLKAVTPRPQPSTFRPFTLPKLAV